MTEILGWTCSAILLVTLIKQIHTQATEKSSEGVSPLLFAGQLLTSIGFVVYSYLTGSIVFIVTNLMLTVTSIIGVYFYFRFAKN